MQPTLDTFAVFLQQHGFAKTTRRVYFNAARRMDRNDPISWLQQQAARRLSSGSLSVLRAATGLVLQHFHGLSEPEARARLPRLTGRKQAQKEGLTPGQLVIYEGLAAKQKEPVRTVLLLLPVTGMRISEACDIQWNHLQAVGNDIALVFTEKGGRTATLILGKKAKQLLACYRQGFTGPRAGPLFPSTRGTAVSPVTVRRATTAMAKLDPRLQGLTPHILRHTFCTNLAEKGVGLEVIRDLARHESTATTSRYTRTSRQRQREALDML